MSFHPESGFINKTRSIAAIALMIVFMPWLVMGEEGTALKITDKQGRDLEVMILGVTDGQVEMRRLSDRREFSVPIDSLSEASQKQIELIVQEAARKAEAAAIPDVVIPDQVLAQFKTRWAAMKDSLSVAINPAQLQPATTQLMEVLALEKDLIIAGSPKDPASPIDWPDALDRRTREKVTELRQTIRDNERGSLLKRMGVDIEGRFHSSLDDKERLNSLYDASLKPLKRSLAKAQKALAKETSSKLPAERVVDELNKEADQLKAAISSLQSCIFGVQGEEWWSYDPNWPDEHAAEILRKEISEARRTYHDSLTKAANHEGEDEYQLAEIDGVSFYSANFGVILDVSGSMTPHIEALKKDINKNFQSPLYREVGGCRLDAVEKDGHFRAMRANDTMSAVEEMLLVYKVDTIYWFCDLNDARSDEALHHLGELLRKSGARLYVRSVGHRPDRKLKELISDF